MPDLVPSGGVDGRRQGWKGGTRVGSAAVSFAGRWGRALLTIFERSCLDVTRLGCWEGYTVVKDSWV